MLLFYKQPEDRIATYLSMSTLSDILDYEHNVVCPTLKSAWIQRKIPSVPFSQEALLELDDRLHNGRAFIEQTTDTPTFLLLPISSSCPFQRCSKQSRCQAQQHTHHVTAFRVLPSPSGTSDVVNVHVGSCC